MSFHKLTLVSILSIVLLANLTQQLKFSATAGTRPSSRRLSQDNSKEVLKNANSSKLLKMGIGQEVLKAQAEIDRKKAEEANKNLFTKGIANLVTKNGYNKLDENEEERRLIL